MPKSTKPLAEIHLPHFAPSLIHAKSMKDTVTITNSVNMVCYAESEIVHFPWVMPMTLIVAMVFAMIGWI